MKKLLIISCIVLVALGLAYYAYVEISYIVNGAEEIILSNIEKESPTAGAENLTGISIFNIGDSPDDIKNKAQQKGIDLGSKWIHPSDSNNINLSDDYILEFPINKEIRIDMIWLYFYQNKLYRLKMANWRSDDLTCYNKMPIVRDVFIKKHGNGICYSNALTKWNSGHGVRAEYIDGEDFHGKRRSLTIETADTELLREIAKYKKECAQKEQQEREAESQRGI